jgi:branched-chain amino acid transport system permease protein
MVALPASTTQPRTPADVVAPVLIFIALAAVSLVAIYGAQTYVLDLFSRIMIFAIAAVALDFLIGYGGLISFGHAAFVGLGAYAVGILSVHGFTDALIA